MNVTATRKRHAASKFL